MCILLYLFWGQLLGSARHAARVLLPYVVAVTAAREQAVDAIQGWHFPRLAGEQLGFQKSETAFTRLDTPQQSFSRPASILMRNSILYVHDTPAAPIAC